MVDPIDGDPDRSGQNPRPQAAPDSPVERPSTPPGGASAGPPQSPSRRGGRGLKIALAVSLGLNLAVGGLILGAALDRQQGPERPLPAAVARELGLGPYFRALPPELQRAVARDVRRSGEAGGRLALIRAIRNDFRTSLAILRTEPFDPDAFAAALSLQTGRLVDRREVSAGVLIEALAAMPPSARAAYADALEGAMRRPLRRD